MDRRHFLIALTPTMLLLPACASSGAAGGGSSPRRNSNVLTAEDLATYQQDSLHDAIRRLRATWLRRRGAGTSTSVEVVQVYVDNARMGDSNALRNIAVNDVARVEYMNGGDATTRFGTGHGGGAILVTTR